jgi:predicted Zn-dependent protease
MRRKLSLLLILMVHLAACQVNPVTGERNFQIYDSDWENQVGTQMYAPMKQSQGGDFLLDPALSDYVESVGERLAARARRKDEFEFEFSILNDSVPNAWALPGGKIVINRGLLTELGSEAELAAVLGHEIVHADAAHGARAQSKGMLTQIGAVATMVILGSTIESESGRQIAMMVPALGAQLLTTKYGRDAERESDEYGMRYMSEAGYDPQGAIELQETFVKLSEGRNQDWLSGMFASHPPSRERVENNRKTAAELPGGGETGRERYRQATAYLRRVQPAYKAFDEANEALSEDDTARAQEKLNEAMAIEPRESLFHALQGDIHAMKNKNRSALKSYNKAVRANENLFYGYLRRGQIEYRLDHPEAARSDLETSLEMMPTAEAHYVLGLLDKDQGDTDTAIEHFRTAAQSDTETGHKAQRELMALDLPRNPGAYVASRLATDDAGRVWMLLGNTTRVSIKNIQITYAWLDDQGRSRDGRKTFRGPLEGGQQDRLALGIRIQIQDATELSRRVRAEVSGATLDGS